MEFTEVAALHRQVFSSREHKRPWKQKGNLYAAELNQKISDDYNPVCKISDGNSDENQ